jgi:YVTN family beta-propeller protein
MNEKGFVHILPVGGLVAALAALLSINSCLGNLPSGPNQNGGFFVYSELVYTDPVIGIPDTEPIPGQYVNGAFNGTYTGGPLYGSVLSFPFGTGFAQTDDTGTLFVGNGLVNAYWDFGGQWTFPCNSSQNFFLPDVPITTDVPWFAMLCVQVPDMSVDTMNPQFSIAGTAPATLTVASSDLTTSAGMPLLYVWNFGAATVQPPTLISETSATAVSPDGTTATFNFPTYNGGRVPAGIYTYGLFNQQSAGPQSAGHGLLSIGTSSAYESPYGVAAFNVTTTTTCTIDPGDEPCAGYPTTTTAIEPYVTLYNSAAISYGGSLVTVGAQPSAITLYGTYSTLAVSCNGSGCPGQGPQLAKERQQPQVACNGSCTYIDTTVTRPANALVANSGSASVSVVNLKTGAVASIPVGTQPIALSVDSATTPKYAYIANYGSGTVSQVDLSTDTVTGTVSVGPDPMSLTIDPSGTSFWVGGLDYISEVSMSGLSVTSTYPVVGQVTSLAIAAQQNALLYTLVTNTTFQVSQSNLRTGAFVAAYAQSQYQPQCQGCEVSPVPLLANGIIVAANYSNNAVVSVTPTGFVVLDLSTGRQLLQGSTATTASSIATDPSQGMIYLAVPNSNSLVSVPLPPIAAN